MCACAYSFITQAHCCADVFQMCSGSGGLGAEAGSETLDVCVLTPWELDCRCSHKQQGRVHRPTSVHLWDRSTLLSLRMTHLHLLLLQLQGGGHACLSCLRVCVLMDLVLQTNALRTPHSTDVSTLTHKYRGTHTY